MGVVPHLGTDDKGFKRQNGGAALRLLELRAGKVEKDSDVVLSSLTDRLSATIPIS